MRVSELYRNAPPGITKWGGVVHADRPKDPRSMLRRPKPGYLITYTARPTYERVTRLPAVSGGIPLRARR